MGAPDLKTKQKQFFMIKILSFLYRKVTNNI